MLQAPVPVVVVVGAEVLGTAPQLQPHGSVQSEPHVVLAAHPRRHFRLKGKIYEDIQKENAKSIIITTQAYLGGLADPVISTMDFSA